MIRQILAIVKKDFLNELSYKTAFFSSFLAVACNLFIFYFIDKLFGHRITPHLEEFGVNFFSYIILSLAFMNYIGVGAGSFANRIRQEQLQGTLESLFLTPTKFSIILMGMGVWNFIFATINVTIYLCLGVFLFKINLQNVNILSLIIILILTIISFSSIGIISASFIMFLKKGNPIDWLINSLEGILGGIYFPITVLPSSLQIAAKCLPITYAIRAMELAVYQGYSIGELRAEIYSLIFFSLLLIPLSILSFQYALKKTRQKGTLSHY